MGLDILPATALASGAFVRLSVRVIVLIDSSPGEVLPRKILTVNTLSFLAAFAAWVMFGPSVRVIASELEISEGMAVWLKAAPILTGSLLRAPIGVFTDRLGGRFVFSALLVIGAVSVGALSFATSAIQLLIGGIIMGVVGTTFVVGVQSVSSWSPTAKQGVALGIFSFGTAGTAFSTLLMPWLLEAMGWRDSFRVYAGMLLLSAIAYWIGVRDVKRSGDSPSLKSLLLPILDRRTWAFGVYYMATFGVFVAGALCFGDLYIDRYGVSMKTAGVMATSFTLTAAAARTPGGWLSDKLGARPVLGVSLLLTAAFMAPVMLGLSLWPTVVLIFLSALAMGVGMGATYKYIPECFPENVGAVGGLVGALGGLAGFFLPLLGSASRSAFGSQIAELFPLLAMILFAVLVLALSRKTHT